MIRVLRLFWNFLSCFVSFWTSFTFELYIVQKYTFEETLGRRANPTLKKKNPTMLSTNK